jgi:hypothetical protein
LQAITYLGRYNKQKAWKNTVDESISELIRPDRPIDEKIITMAEYRRQKKADLTEGKRKHLVIPI